MYLNLSREGKVIIFGGVDCPFLGSVSGLFGDLTILASFGGLTVSIADSDGFMDSEVFTVFFTVFWPINRFATRFV